MTSVLYFHGFASSPASAKITALRPLLAPHGIEINAPDLNVPSFEQMDFDAMVELALRAAREHPPRAMVGSSLGAQIALAAAKRGIAVPLVLIAPAIGQQERWREQMPKEDPVTVFNFARNGNAPIHRAFFAQMLALDVDADPPASRVTVIMGRDDQTVSFERVEGLWRAWEASGRLAEGSRFIEIPEGDHGLVGHTELIGQVIVEAVQ
ncbi:MAG TPA: YqiA/YcfP family alpha/beta fold hydrolase [Candidatus Limnocylindrales bacterium]|nr:YqiA/YcfP family alpha/beta fold hydrolase [Candidatus Limnocylindrales bacterium]